MAIDLTERLLMDAGGWQALKHARALLESGRVVSAAYMPPLLKGVVREGDSEFRAGLKIASKGDIENLCTCRPSREWGTICPHSLAVGLAVLAPKGSGRAAPASAATVAASRGSATPAAAPVPELQKGPRFVTDPGVPGEPVTLSVVFPPQFLAAWERGNVTVGVEAQIGSRRVLVGALNERGTFRSSEADFQLVETLRKLNNGAVAGMLSLPGEAALALLEGLRGHPRVTFGKSTAVEVSAAPVLPKLEANTDGQGRLSLRVAWPPETHPLLGSTRAWCLRGTVFAPVAPGLPAAYLELLRKEIVLPAEQAGAFLANELPALRTCFEAVGNAVSGEAPRLVPEPTAFSLALEGSLNHLTARLQCRYSAGRIVTLGRTPASENWARPDPDAPARILCRNLEAERAALARLAAYGFGAPDRDGECVLRGERAILAFFGEGYPRLQREWEVSLGARFANVTKNVERIAPRIEITGSGEEWFELRFDLEASGGERFPAAEVQRLLQLGQNHVRLKNGKIAVFSAALLDDFGSVLRDCDPQQPRPGAYRIGQAHAGYLEAAVSEAGFELAAPGKWREWAQTQRGNREIEPLALGDLEPVLRGYQKQGASWLKFLADHGLGGVLADDMGLGKTLQALAFLRTQPGPALLVCPSSLVFNWRREVEKFTPERRLLVIEGGARAPLFAQIPDADLVVTSYPLLRRDAPRYRGFEFSTVILDEAQHIRNPDTQNAQAAGLLRARRKFILTGTPVENSVRDIWSLMHFVMPGYLGDRDDFRERYEIPISRHRCAEAMARLSKRLRPFLLRRRKEEVAADLPQKLEQVVYCELNEAQRRAYAALLQGARAQVEEAHGEKNAGRARMRMLTALLRLRQTACDLRLLNKEKGATEGNADGNAETAGRKVEEPLSGKVELFNELLSEAIDGGHRVLVFSQFVSMLTLLRAELEKAGIGSCYLDGQTRDRAAEVDRFQEGDVPVFLISLKAGGTGLNLTAADTVIHFDPWWNPAVEAQATDRAHRIGQHKVVTAYKLIARGTVEEKILNLQQKKREMIAATIETEEPLMEGLTLDEIESLLAE